MQRTWILIAGLVALGLLAAWCLHSSIPHIENDLADRSAAALAGENLAFSTRVKGRRVTLAGSAASAASRDRAAAVVAAVHGVRTVHNQIAVSATPLPGARFEFAADWRDGQVTLTGDVPNDAARASIVGAARQRFPDQQVVDRLTRSTGAPDDFMATAKSGLAQLAQLRNGRLSIVSQRVTIAGVALDTQTKENVEQAVANNFGPNFTATAQVTLARPSQSRIETCQTQFDSLLTGKVIRFTTGSATINADSYPLLDQLAIVVKDCAGVNVEVQGHTDARGSEEGNLSLSQRRAEAVVEYLLREGVNGSQVSARGYGEATPIANNNTPAGRATNRRIEFKTVGNR